MFEDQNYQQEEEAPISDEEFLKANPQDVMQEIDRQVDEYANQTYQENYQQNPQQDAQVPQQQVQQEQPQEGQSDAIDPNVAMEAYRTIMSDFKASGKSFKLRDWHDAIPLMQQGIDYTKKQQQLKPRLMEMKALENNGMLGDNLNYAIDLFQGNPEAIKKLIQDKKIDINSLVSKSTDEWGNPVEGASTSEYIPNNHRISESQYRSQEALEDIKQSPAYTKVLDYLTNLAATDKESVSRFLHEPNALKGLTTLMEEGMHDKIISEITYARSINNPEFANMSDYDAYVAVATKMYQQQHQQQQAPQYTQPQQPQYVQPQQQYMQQPIYQQPQQINPYQQQQMQQQQIMQQRKQSVSPIRANGNGARPMYDPLNCSDAEFAKINLNDLLRM